MPAEFYSLLPIMSREAMPPAVDLQEKDGDPRKSFYAYSLLHKFPHVLEAWRKIDLLMPVRIDDCYS